MKKELCHLAALANPRLGGAALGLTWDVDGQLGIARASFPCCAGQGMRHDHDAGVSTQCSLGVRLKEARRLSLQLARLVGDSTAMAQVVTGGPPLGPWLERLSQLAARRSRRGIAWTALAAPAAPEDPRAGTSGAGLGAGASGLGPGASGLGTKAPARALGAAARALGADFGSGASPPAGGSQPASAAAARRGAGAALAPPPPSVWTIAFAAAWRFGLRPHVVILGKTKPGDLLPRAGAAAPDLLIVGQVDKLWEPHTADQLDALAGYAYGAMLPLFLELVSHQDTPAAGPPGPGPATTASGFRSRLLRMKSRSPLIHLPPACVAKLLEVTDGVAALAAQAARERAAQARPRAKMPRLPWDG